MLYAAKLSGNYPDLPTTVDLFETWKDETLNFSQQIIEQLADNPTFIDCELNITITDHQLRTVDFSLAAKLPVKAQQLVFYRSSGAKAKDYFTLYLHQLIVQVWQEQQLQAGEQINENHPLAQVNASRGLYFDTKSKKVNQYILSDLPNAKQQLTVLLTTFLQGEQQALLLNGELAEKVFNTKVRGKPKEFTQADFEKSWQDPNIINALGHDPYIEYFWPECPQLIDYQSQLSDVYYAMYQHLQTIKPPTAKNKTSMPKGER